MQLVLRPSEHARKDSGISISSILKPKLKATVSTETAVSIVSTSTSTSRQASTFTVPTPSPTATTPPYPGPRLIKKSTITQWKQKKALYELVKRACEASCALILRRSVKNEGLTLLATDPAVVDFLLLCIGCARDVRMADVKLLPGKCPIQENKVANLLVNMPALSNRHEEEGQPTTEALLSSMSRTHRALVTYLVSTPLTHLTSLSPTLHPNISFPSLSLLPRLPHTFLTTHQPSRKEALFRTHASRAGHVRVTVFHGTHPCRLPLILAQGLRNLSGTKLERHGTCRGQGIYLARDSGVALGYAMPGDVWGKSRFGIDGDEGGSGERRQIMVLLGCEVVVPLEKVGEYIFVEKDEGKVVVRFVWILPGGTRRLDDKFGTQVKEAMEALRTMRGE